MNMDDQGPPSPTVKAPRRSRHRLFTLSGLTDRKLATIGAIAILAGRVEHHTELAIWSLEGTPEPGTIPWTDSKPISLLIERMERLGQLRDPKGFGGLISEWCAVARPAYECRNSIMHGITGIGSEDWSLFTRNEPVGAIRRKRAAAEFHATENTLALLEEVFEECFTGVWIIEKIASGRRPDGYFDRPLAALRRARITAIELADLAAAQSEEIG